jgi:hypothetical protein
MCTIQAIVKRQIWVKTQIREKKIVVQTQKFPLTPIAFSSLLSNSSGNFELKLPEQHGNEDSQARNAQDSREGCR